MCFSGSAPIPELLDEIYIAAETIYRKEFTDMTNSLDL
jgi:hypothetical protein